MADKELTIFVVDLASPKNVCNYVLNAIAGKLLKGLKTDLVSVVLFHSQTTSHSSASSGKFKGINVLLDFEQPSYIQLQRLYRILALDSEACEVTPETSDLVQSVLFSSTLLAPTKGKVFTRNIVLATDVASVINTGSVEKIESVPKFLQGLPVNMYAIVHGLKDNNATEVRLMASHFKTSQIMSDIEADEVVAHHPPIKKTRPVSLFRGDLRLGANYSRVLTDPSYDADRDNSCVSFKVDVYPATKSEANSLGIHEYLVENGSVVKLDRSTKYFVWEKNFQGEKVEDDEAAEVNDKQYDKIPIEHSHITQGFKFSNFDLLALDSDLKQAATLKIQAAFDIMRFLDVDSIPIAYLTSEALLVVPEKDSSFRNITNHNAFCISLIEERKAILARFVKKSEKEIEVGVLYPVQIKDQNLYTHSLVFIRLPFKEDIKVGRFIKLSGQNALKQKDKPSPDLASINNMMENFIEARTIAEPEAKFGANHIINNGKISMKSLDSSKLPLIPKGLLATEFFASDPGANKFSSKLRKLLLSSLNFDEMQNFYDDIKLETRSLDSSETNLFNLHNALAVNSPLKDPEELLKLAVKGIDISKKLAEEIGTAYVRKEDVKKRKITKDQPFQSKGNYGSEEKGYDEVPDFGF